MEKALIAVIGGGASGLMAAYAAAKEVQREKKNATVMIFRGKRPSGEKIVGNREWKMQFIQRKHFPGKLLSLEYCILGDGVFRISKTRYRKRI